MKTYRLASLFLLVLLANPAVAVRQRSGDEYLVKPQDTGYGISQKYGLTLSELARLNPRVNISALKAGETVRVSGTSEPIATGKTEEATKSKPSIEPEVTVRPDAVEPTKPVRAVRSRKIVKTIAPAASAAEPVSVEAKEPAKPAQEKPAVKVKSSGYLSNFYNEPAKPAKEKEPSVAASLMRVVGALVFVVALAVLSLYALKHFTSSKGNRKSPRRSIKVIETAGLGPNRSLHVVQAGDKFLLIGSTPNQINIVAELNTPEAEESTTTNSDDFASILHESSSDQDRADTASTLSEVIRDGASFLQKKTSATRSMRAKAEIDES